MDIMFRHPQRCTTLLTAICVVFGLSCSGGSAGNGSNGHWIGEALSFHVVDDALHDIWIKNASCNGEDVFGNACGFALTNEYISKPLTISNGRTFSGTLYTDGIRVFEIVKGTFSTGNEAVGTYLFTAEGCCTAEDDFVVYLEQPLTGPDPVEDAGSQKDTASPNDILGPAGDGGTIEPGTVDPISTTCQEGFKSTTFGGCSPVDADSYQLQAVTEMNRIRAYIEVQPLNANAAINQAAQAHCECFVNHYFDVYQTQNLSPHQEDPSHDDCVAKDFWGRMTHFGYSGNASAEIMGFMSNPVDATHGWLETLYHRIPIVDPNSYEVGYGLASRSETGCDTADFGSFNGPDSGLEVIYPIHGQVGVATQWHGYESPQPPLPEGESYPSGPIITLTIPRGSDLVVESYSFTHPSGADVPAMFTAPSNNTHLDRTTALYSHDPLDPMTAYTVTFEGRKGNAPWTRTWSFTTGSDGPNWDYGF